MWRTVVVEEGWASPRQMNAELVRVVEGLYRRSWMSTGMSEGSDDRSERDGDQRMVAERGRREVEAELSMEPRPLARQHINRHAVLTTAWSPIFPWSCLASAREDRKGIGGHEGLVLVPQLLVLTVE
jgi:hypothetical protein